MCALPMRVNEAQHQKEHFYSTVMSSDLADFCRFFISLPAHSSFYLTLVCLATIKYQLQHIHDFNTIPVVLLSLTLAGIVVPCRSLPLYILSWPLGLFCLLFAVIWFLLLNPASKQ